MRRTAAILVALFALSSTAHAVVAPNLIANPNFDTGADGWTLPTSSNPGSSSWQTVDALGSSHSGSLLATSSGQFNDNPYPIATQCVSLASSSPGTDYTLA